MASQALNFLWLNLDFPAKPDPEDGSIREPLPLRYVENIRKAGGANPGADIVLWVDSMRLTERQLVFLQESLEQDRPNVRLRDLRSIRDYRRQPLYNQPETNPDWRRGSKHSLIWRQVDAAKILISLQGDYDQSFFCDLDYSHLPINGEKIQGMLGKHSFMVGSGSDSSTTGIENQLWGFARSRRPFFETYYETALERAEKGFNAWSSLCDKVRLELHKKEGIPLEEICFPASNDGTMAEQTGHEWRNGDRGKKTPPATVEKGELTRLFNARSRRLPADAPAFPEAAAYFNDIALPPPPAPAPAPSEKRSFFQKARQAFHNVFAGAP